MRPTFQLQANEVRVAQVFQKDAVGRAGLEIERDVSAGLALEGGKMQIGWRGGEGGSVPVVACEEKRNEAKTLPSTQKDQAYKSTQIAFNILTHP